MFGERGIVELVFLAAVALIVVGPKDLPILMRRIGQFTAKMRGLAAEFRASFDEMARQSELDELRKEVEALRTGQTSMASHQADIEQHFDEIHHSLNPIPSTPPSLYADPWPQGAAEPVDQMVDEDETPDLFADLPPASVSLDVPSADAPRAETQPSRANA